MEKIFLDDMILNKESLLKYTIVQIVEKLGHTEISSSYLGSELKLSTRTIYTLVEQVNKDFLAFTGEFLFTINRGKKLQVNSSIASSSFYRAHLFQKSSLFSFFYALSFTRNGNFDSFCDHYYVTPSSMKRKLEPFKPVLKNFNIRLSISKFELVGAEENIRAFLYYFFWIGTNCIFWPFENINEKEISYRLKKNPALSHFLLNDIVLKQISFWLAISINRTSLGKMINSNTFIESLLEKNSYFQAVKYQFGFEPLPNFRMTDLNFLFLSITCIPIYSRTSHYSEYLDSFYKEQLPELYSLCLDYKRYIFSHSAISDKEFHSFHFVNLLSITAGIHLQGIAFLNIQRFHSSSFLKAVALSKSFLEKNKHVLAGFIPKEKIELAAHAYAQFLILSFGSEMFNPPAHIGIIWELERLPLNQLQEILKSPAGIKLTEINQNSDKNNFDLIIATSFLELQKNTRLYVWQNESLLHNVINILSIINDVQKGQAHL